MDFEATRMPDVWLVTAKPAWDERGSFVKVFNTAAFAAHADGFTVAESFFSTSAHGVLRGMHFQVPPAAQRKLVYCAAGRALDVLVDLRVGSPSFGAHLATELSADNHRMVLMPAGIAHGFLSLEPNTTLVYLVSAGYQPTCDLGIRWDSFGMDWPLENPVVSPRDASFPALAEFVSPFAFRASHS